VVGSQPIEQISLTNDTSDYLYYSTMINVPSNGSYKLSMVSAAVSSSASSPPSSHHTIV
jgi:hypothetical protein